jgi:hypothetical protein
MPRKPRTLRTTCTVCGEPREQGSRHALCEKHRKAAESRNAQRWRERHPEKLRQIWDAENAARKVARVPKPIAAKPAPVRRPPAPAKPRYTFQPQPELVIGPQAFVRVEPVGVVRGKYRRYT